MKTKNFILSAGLLALSLTGCTDLDVNVKSQYTGLVSSPEAVQANMANLFFQMRDCLGRRYMEAMCLSSDEYTSVAYSGNWIDSYAYAHPSYHTCRPEDATMDWMGVLGRANVLANEIVASDYTEENKCAARAMRCFYTFLIMENFGDAPIPDAEYKQTNGLDLFDRNPRPEVAKWIEKELLDVYDKLPEVTTGDNYGKPNKYMALALLAKLYINWPVYTSVKVADYNAASAQNEKLADCIKVCDQIINSNKFALGPVSYRFKFAHNNTELVESGQIKDFIYVMPYDTYEAQGMQWNRSHAYKDIKNLNPSYFGEKMGQSGGGYMTITPECVDRFNLPGDERNWMIIGLQDKDGNDAGGQVYVYDPTTLLPTDQKVLDKTGAPLVLSKNITIPDGNDIASVDVGDNLTGWSQGYRSVKWFMCSRDYNNGRHLSNDVPIFRYADILLIKAEALVRSGQSGAATLFNQIRSYVNAPTISGEPKLDDIYMERGREFFDELWRRNDMIRFGHYEDEWFPHYKDNPNASFDPNMRVFPVSKNDLDVNPTWSQNLGY
ncbi:RagB/SusD family nutrient uptake outer membrane protein [uncultured Bacteroides sp.]|uniref:RagB/SusD family nutrient uptake outer membrane protein n=1 Tax=uncultured Bacteroides sp. TaxID=162156 RepID=UPI002621C352|nr:RagB/SusD family nutrient uptake outer membrane protein [uncultured Bacteroides sp.]